MFNLKKKVKPDKVIDHCFNFFLSQETKKKSERIILIVAIASYVLHLLLILLVNQNIVEANSSFLSSPIAAIYTPFSFILIYEVYLLVFFLPKSISFYIGKQYEIILLIVIRKIFKDISNIELSSQWFYIRSDLEFTYDVITSLILFFLIFFFYKNIAKRNQNSNSSQTIKKSSVLRFIRFKRTMAVVLVPVLVFLAGYSFFSWTSFMIQDYQNGILAFKNINNVFFDEFFTVLVVADVLLLLSSLFYSDKFYKIIRNSGFVISTILIKMSFSTEGITNNALILGSVLFGLLILIIHNLYEKNASQYQFINETSHDAKTSQ